MSDIENRLQSLGKSTLDLSRNSTISASLKSLNNKPQFLNNSMLKGKDMSTLDSIVGKNKEAVKLAGKLEVGNTATNILASKIKAQLPMMARGYAEHPLFKVAVGNAAAAAISHFAPNNKKANIVGDAMIAAAMQQFVQSFDMPSLIEELINGVDLNSLIESE